MLVQVDVVEMLVPPILEASLDAVVVAHNCVLERGGTHATVASRHHIVLRVVSMQKDVVWIAGFVALQHSRAAATRLQRPPAFADEATPASRVDVGDADYDIFAQAVAHRPLPFARPRPR